MEHWPLDQSLMDLLWIGGLAATPLALVAELLARTSRIRPATRHALWAAVLLSFVTPAVAHAIGHPSWLAARLRSAFGAASAVLIATPEAIRDRPSTLAPPTPVPPSNRVARDTASTSASREASASTEPPARVIANHRTSPPASRRLAAEDQSRSDDTSHTIAAPTQVGPVASIPNSLIDPPSPPDAVVASTPAAVQPLDPALLTTTRLLIPQWDWAAFTGRLAALRDAITSLSPISPIVWAVGLLTIVCLRLTRMMAMRRILRGARPAPHRITRVVKQVADEIGLASVPETLLSDESISPLVTCGVRPKLVLPAALWASLDDLARCSVLVHELAHLRRRDHRVCWFEWIVGAIYWWHPVAWWARKRLRDEAEACCDAWVISVFPAARRHYAESLVLTRSFLAQHDPGLTSPALRGGPTLGIVSRHARKLTRRITMVMTTRTAPRMSLVGVLMTLGFVGFGAVVTPTLACPPESKTSARAGTDLSTRARAQAAEEAARAAAPVETQSLEGEFFGEAPALEALRRRGPSSDAAPARAPHSANSFGTLAPLAPIAPLAPMTRGGRTIEVAPNAFAELSVATLPSPNWLGGGLGPMATEDGPLPGTTPRAYHLPEGKLMALKGLMERADVPIWMECNGDHLVFHATPQGHEVLAAFVRMIHPDGAEAQVGSARAALLDAELYAAAIQEAGASGRSSFEAALERHAQQRLMLEAQLEALAEAAELAADRSERMQGLVESLADQASDAEDAEARRALEAAAQSLRSRATAHRTQSRNLENQVRALEQQIDELESRMEWLERDADAARDGRGARGGRGGDGGGVGGGRGGFGGGAAGPRGDSALAPNARLLEQAARELAEVAQTISPAAAPAVAPGAAGASTPDSRPAPPAPPAPAAATVPPAPPAAPLPPATAPPVASVTPIALPAPAR